MREIFKKIQLEVELTKEEIIRLLEVDVCSEEFYKLISLANSYSRKKFNNKGVIFIQVGIDLSACTANCKFCSLAKDVAGERVGKRVDIDNLLKEVQLAIDLGVTEVFLMTTASYSFDEYLDIAKQVKPKLPENIRMIGNTGDFNVEQAQQLKDVGFDAIYHICRLREGIDTDLDINIRIATLDAIKEVGLELYYCVEPIGAEHTKEEIADEIIRATKYPVSVMASMRRVSVKNTVLGMQEEISELELAKVVAVSTIVVRPTRAMGVHEPNQISLLSGANQLYAEVGVNPRDISTETKNGRGFTVERVKNMLKETQWDF